MNIIPPKEVENNFTLSYQELKLLLLDVGTTSFMRGHNAGKCKVTMHSNAAVVPLVETALKHLKK